MIAHYSWVSAITLSLFTFNVQADEFWASKIGGGPGEVLEYNIISEKYQDQSKIAYVDPASDGTYSIYADSDVTVYADESIPLINIENVNNRSKVPTYIDSNGANAIQLSEGHWTVKTEPSSNKRSSATDNVNIISHFFSAAVSGALLLG